MKRPKVGDRVRVNDEITQLGVYGPLSACKGKVCVCLLETKDGFADVSDESHYRLKDDQYTIIGFKDYLDEIEK